MKTTTQFTERDFITVMYGGSQLLEYANKRGFDATEFRNQFNAWWETQVKEVNGKQPISNGRVNQTLTLEEMKQFSLGQKIKFCSSLQHEGTSSYAPWPLHVKNWEPMKELFTWTELKDLTSEDVDKALTMIKHNLDLQILKAESNQFCNDYEEGVKIRRAEKELNFSGEIRLSIGQLCGYVKEVGQWNGFYPEKVMPVLQAFDDSVPRRDYGVNNPNTGGKQHFWTMKGDYIFINVEYISTAEMAKWEKWLKEVGLMQQHELQADSMRLNVEDVPSISGTGEVTHHYIQVVMWWD